MAEPFSETREPAAETVRRKAEFRRMVKAYNSTFSSANGRMVLADLKAKFGFDKWDAADTEDADKIARRVCMKGPIYHIERMRLHIFRKDAKPLKAISGDSVETREQ